LENEDKNRTEGIDFLSRIIKNAYNFEVVNMAREARKKSSTGIPKNVVVGI
jgi:hypothetical protein